MRRWLQRGNSYNFGVKKKHSAMVPNTIQYRPERFIPKWEAESAEEGRGKWRRFGGWGSSLSRWLDWVRDNVKSE